TVQVIFSHKRIPSPSRGFGCSPEVHGAAKTPGDDGVAVCVNRDAANVRQINHRGSLDRNLPRERAVRGRGSVDNVVRDREPKLRVAGDAVISSGGWR